MPLKLKRSNPCIYLVGMDLELKAKTLLVILGLLGEKKRHTHTYTPTQK